MPESDADLRSQRTISRLENLPGAVALKRMMAAMVELFCDSFKEMLRRLDSQIAAAFDSDTGEIGVGKRFRLVAGGQGDIAALLLRQMRAQAAEIETASAMMAATREDKQTEET